MAVLNNMVRVCLVIIVLIIMYSCDDHDSFKPDYLKLTQSFGETTTKIYQSEIGQRDTITFYKVKREMKKIRNIELGFYNKYQLYVDYRLSPGSYHQFTTLAAEYDKEGNHKIISVPDTGRINGFIILTQDGSNKLSEQVSFLGISLDQERLDDIVKSTKNEINFAAETDKEWGYNVNEGIKFFKLNLSKGIVSYVDKDNITWTLVDTISGRQNETK